MQSANYIKSPLNYIGGKYKLLPQILELFPKNINTFVDVFGGGFNVGANINCNKIIYNDNIPLLVDLMNTFYTYDVEYIVNKIENNIINYNLSKTNKEAYLNFRKYFNSNITKDPIDFYTLILFSFNYQIRFNSKMEYNNTFGQNRSEFNDRIKSNLINFVNLIQNKNIEFYNKDFLKLNLSLASQDFVYCDPPYLITTGSYNDGKRGFKGWSEKEELELYHYLDVLDSKNMKFALSNVIESNNKENHLLKNWTKKYNIHRLNYNYNHSNFHRKNINDSIEVLITNY